jgi:hypothetical protein
MKLGSAYRINQAPMQVDGQEIDLYILQDAGSMFIFGNIFAPHGSEYPSTDEVERLLLSAHSRKEAWPSELVLPGAPRADNSFIKIAKKHGFKARAVPESQMSFYIKDTQEAYEEFLSRDTGDASYGRNPCCQRPPAQTRTCSFPASGSSVVLAFASSKIVMQIPCAVASAR